MTTPARPPLDREAFIERLMEEFDLLCLGIPSQRRIEDELAIAGIR